MRDSNQGWFQRQVTFLRRQFLQDAELPFTDVLSETIVAQALTAIDVYWMDRVYPPLITLWVFLSQVLSADHSCRAAVARLIAHRISRGQGPCSPDTGAYCQARKRLPEKFFSTVACGPDALWKRAWIVNGSGKTAAFICSTGRRCQCLTRRLTNKRIRSSTIRLPALAFPLQGSPPSFLWLVGRSSIWASAVTRAKAREKSVCFAGCGVFFSPVTCC